MPEIVAGPDDKYVIVFRGKSLGIGLYQPGKQDDSVRIDILVEDDGCWQKTKNGCFHSHWLPELSRCIKAADDWMSENCVKVKWGYRFGEK